MSDTYLVCTRLISGQSEIEKTREGFQRVLNLYGSPFPIITIHSNPALADELVSLAALWHPGGTWDDDLIKDHFWVEADLEVLTVHLR